LIGHQAAMDQGSSTDVIYFDFSRAFDGVLHNRLLSKLNSKDMVLMANCLNGSDVFLLADANVCISMVSCLPGHE